MATIAMLQDKGDLIEYEPDLDPREFPTRWIHQASAFPGLFASLKNEQPDAPRPLSPFEQVEQALYDYCIGRPLAYDYDRKMLNPKQYGVWEIKTADVRVFGWLPERRHMIVVSLAMKRDLIPSSKYKPYVSGVVDFRDKLNLDYPKFLTGASPRDIC